MSLAASLFSPAQAKVLTWLFGQPQRWYHVNELLRLTGLGSASLQRELKRLALAGLLAEERVANLRRVRANPASPIYSELVVVVQKALGAEPILQHALQPFAARIEPALIYGSFPRQTDHANTDIDLMLVADALGTGDLLPAVLEAEQHLGRRIRPTIYTATDFSRRRADATSFVSNVLSQPTLILIGSLDNSAGT